MNVGDKIVLEDTAWLSGLLGHVCTLDHSRQGTCLHYTSGDESVLGQIRACDEVMGLDNKKLDSR